MLGLALRGRARGLGFEGLGLNLGQREFNSMNFGLDSGLVEATGVAVVTLGTWGGFM